MSYSLWTFLKWQTTDWCETTPTSWQVSRDLPMLMNECMLMTCKEQKSRGNIFWLLDVSVFLICFFSFIIFVCVSNGGTKRWSQSNLLVISSNKHKSTEKKMWLFRYPNRDENTKYSKPPPRYGTLPKTNIPPVTWPSQKETQLPTTNFQVQAVSFRGGIYCHVLSIEWLMIVQLPSRASPWISWLKSLDSRGKK